ncbi:LysR substrate-binding domain-containing protein [Streptomyces sp. NPDC052309]|uniref:LysR substrate-binding domain-containing protein n=1 Tax=Streptomyces sp. NPDC052309 TaxID=3155421 RepID=UPI0034245FE2
MVRAGGTADGPVIRSVDPQDRIEAGLLADEIDLGIAFEQPRAAGITAQALFTEHLSLVVTAHGGDPEGERPLPVARLAEQRLARLSNELVTRGHIDGYFAGHHVSPPIAVEANSIQALTEIRGAGGRPGARPGLRTGLSARRRPASGGPRGRPAVDGTLRPMGEQVPAGVSVVGAHSADPTGPARVPEVE